jgi:transcriptional regulator with XRE-family HTH domain
MSTFSKNLRFLRKKGNHNQEDIALLFKKKANTIGNWENQKSEPALVELMKLADFFHVSTEDLLLTDLAARDHVSYAGREISSNTGSAVRSLESFKTHDIPGNTSIDGSLDAFWFVLRELKALNEKVDLLLAGSESSAVSRNSDKSYH